MISIASPFFSKSRRRLGVRKTGGSGRTNAERGCQKGFTRQEARAAKQANHTLLIDAPVIDFHAYDRENRNALGPDRRGVAGGLDRRRLRRRRAPARPRRRITPPRPLPAPRWREGALCP